MNLQGFIMKKISLICCLLPVAAFAETEAQIELNNAIEIVRMQCRGISARMEGVKKMAGVGTAVNVIGTATGVGGVASGVVKYNKDVDTIKGIKDKSELDSLIAELKRTKESLSENQDLLQRAKTIDPNIETNLQKLANDLAEEEKLEQQQQILEQSSADLQKEIDKSQQESIKSGNIRTGLFATDTAANVAGAVVSANTVVDKDFVEQIKLCAQSMDKLRDARTRVKIEEGLGSAPALMERSQKILEKCSEYEYVNVQQLNSLAKGAMISNSVGAATGAAATITSVLGNNKKVTDIKKANDEKAAKEYNAMNFSSNVLGGVTAAASLSGTVLNASQIKTAKQILSIAEECEGALQ